MEVATFHWFAKGVALDWSVLQNLIHCIILSTQAATPDPELSSFARQQYFSAWLLNIMIECPPDGLAIGSQLGDSNQPGGRVLDR